MRKIYEKFINLLKNILSSWSVIFYSTKIFDTLEDIKKYYNENKKQELIFAFFRILGYLFIILINLVSLVLLIVGLIITYPIFEKILLFLTMASSACLLFCIIFSAIEYINYVYYNSNTPDPEIKHKIIKNITLDSILLVQLIVIILALYFLPPYSSIVLSFCITIIYNAADYLFYKKETDTDHNKIYTINTTIIGKEINPEEKLEPKPEATTDIADPNDTEKKMSIK